MASQSWFAGTARIKKAVALINGVDGAKFPRLLQRILQKLHIRDERTFSKEEEEKLEVALGLNLEEIETILESSSFILEQAAYHSAKPGTLTKQLESLELNDEKISAFVEVWSEQGASVVEKLRQRSTAPKQLQSVNWRLNLQMAQDNKSKLKLPNAFFELGLSNPNSDKLERLRLEFSQEELYAFFNQLETIQTQLDGLNR